MRIITKPLLQAPVILSQHDLQDKVSEVLDAVKKDQEATGTVQAVPRIVLVRTSGCPPWQIARTCFRPNP